MPENISTEEIRGLNIKFDSDFSSFKKGMKEADKDISSTEKQLKSLQKSLNLEFNETKFSKAQKKAQTALQATEQKATLLRQRLLEMESVGVTDKTRDEYNYLSVELEKTELNAERLKNTLKELNNTKIDNLSKEFDKAAKANQNLSRVSAAALAGLVASGVNAVKQADDIATLATKYEMSATALQRFNYVALQTDTDTEQLYKAFVKVRGGVADLSTGISSVATEALKQLGLSFNQFKGTEDTFYGVIKALSEMEDQTKMVSLANDIFGERMATNLFPLIYAGTDAINEYRKEFETLGALTDDQVNKLAEFDNVLNELKTQYTNVALQLGSSLLPVMKNFSNMLTKNILPKVKAWVDWFSAMSPAMQKLTISFIGFLAILSPLLKLISNLIVMIPKLITWFKALNKQSLLLYSKWILLASAISSLFSVLTNWSNMNAVQKIIGLLGSLSATALAAALAFGAFHSAWSMGTAIAGIVAGIAAATIAVKSASKEIGVDPQVGTNSYGSSSYTPSYS